MEKKQTELTGRRNEINTLLEKLKDDQSSLNQDREQFETDKEDWFANQVPKSPIDLMDWLKEKAQFDDDEIAKVISIFTPTTPLSPQSPAPQKLTPRPPSATSQTSSKSSRVGTPTSQHLKSKSEIVTSKSTTPVKSSPRVSNLYRPTAASMLKSSTGPSGGSSPVKRRERSTSHTPIKGKVSETVVRRPTSPMPCSKPNCMVHKHMKENNLISGKGGSYDHDH